MTRKEELKEFMGVLNALMNKYSVNLGVQVVDLIPPIKDDQELSKKIDKALEAEVVK